MKKNKRIISLLLVISLICSQPLVVAAYDGQIQNETVNDDITLDNNQSNTSQDTSVSQSEQSTTNEVSTSLDGENTTETGGERKIEYVYIDQGSLLKNAEQNIVVGLMDGQEVEQATIYYHYDSENVKKSVNFSQQSEGTLLFKPSTDERTGKYIVDSLEYVIAGERFQIELSEEGIEASYYIKMSEEEGEPETNDEIKVEVVDENGKATEADTLEEGLAAIDTTVSSENSVSRTSIANSKANGNIVIVLDPGHDNTHKGASSAQTGVSEEVYTLEIAKACRDYLKQYNGVEVYMTRGDDGSCPYPGTTSSTCNYNRVQYAKSVNANFFVSLHLNSTSSALSSANGAEVFISNYSHYTQDSRELANKILAKLGELGLSNRGALIDADDKDHGKYDDGNWQDDYSVIKNSVLNGFPAIIVEHAFVNNTNDAAIIKNKSVEMGQADAKAIAEHFNLQRGAFNVSPIDSAVVGNKVTLTANTNSIPSKYNEYRFIYYDKGKDTWNDFGEFTKNTSYVWTPSKAGEYILGMEVRNSSNKSDLQQYITWSYFNVKEPTVNIKNITTQELENGLSVSLNCNVESNDSGLQYTYQEYNLQTQQWSVIAAKSANKSAIWKPKSSGAYWLHVVATSSTGKEYSYTMGYQVNKGNAYISEFKVDKASPQVVGTKVNLSASYKALTDETVSCSFMAYDGTNWEDITQNSKNETTWIPKKAGDHLLCYQVTTSTGKVFQSFIGFAVKQTNIKIKGINVGTMNEFGQIPLNAIVETDDKGAKYTFKAYDGAVWHLISQSQPQTSTTWIPGKEGVYLLYLEVESSTGAVETYSMGVQVKGNVKINSFTADKPAPQKLGSSIKLQASASAIGSGACTYQYLAYDGAYWSEISSSKSLTSVDWKPTSGGNYLLCFQIVTSSGMVHQSFIGYNITEPKVNIKGINVGTMNEFGQIPLNAIVETDDQGAKYTFKAYDGGVWHLISQSQPNTSTTWIPGKEGVYLLHLEVESSSGRVYSYSMGVQIKGNVKINSFTVDKVSPQKVGSIIKLQASASAIGSGACTYQYLVYDGAYWSEISSSDKLSAVEWKPTRGGDYLLCFQVITSTGTVYQSFMGYSIEDSRTVINGIELGNINEKGEVSLKANVESGDNNLKYTYKVYNGSKWSLISESSTSKSTVWLPEGEGVFLLYLEVEDSMGRTYTYSCGYQVKNEIKITDFLTSKKAPQKVGNSIILTGVASATINKGLTYSYLVYDGVYWEDIQSSNSLKQAVWTPKQASAYILCFQITSQTGQVIQYFTPYMITGSYVNIQGISVGNINSNGEIALQANVSSNEEVLQYTYKAYDGKEWALIGGPTTNPSMVWKPNKPADYLLYLEVTTSDKQEFTYAMGVAVRNEVSIRSFTTSLMSPQKVGQTITLSASTNATFKDGLIYEYLVYDGQYWASIYKSDNLGNVQWTPTSLGNYLLCFQVTTQSNEIIQSFIGFNITSYYHIMGGSIYSAQQLAKLYMKYNSSYPSDLMANCTPGNNAPSLLEFCKMYIDEAEAEGVKAEVAFCQAMLETGYLKYGGDVKPEQYNFAGLGATGNGAVGASFPDVRTGIRAQIQHLKCYASTDGLKNVCVDPRWWDALRGKAPYIEWLSIPNNPNGFGWAADAKYSEKIQNLIKELSSF